LAVVNTTSTPVDMFTVDGSGNINTTGSYSQNGLVQWTSTTNNGNNVIYFGCGSCAQQVGIGTSTPEAGVMLDVYGVERANEIRVCFETCDFVFDENYKLMSLDSLSNYLKLNHHLPGIQSAKEMDAAGSVSIGKLNSQLLQKVEELTLYTINQDEKEKQQQEKIDKQDEKIKELEERLDALAKQVQK